MASVLVSALYQFAPFDDFADWQAPLLELARAHGVGGSLLLAAEGLNGTIAGPPEGVRAVLDHVRADPRFRELETKDSWADAIPFQRLKVRLKREILTMGVPAIDPRRGVGTYVEPEHWNALLDDPEVLVIDTRNAYEVAIGTFEGAEDPRINSFREFPAWLEARLAARRAAAEPDANPPKIAMFCTGGIRCEKSTAYLRQAGYPEVYHLKGGILKYLETVPRDASRWQGECFVFDERVAVTHGLEPGEHVLCKACGAPFHRDLMTAATYEVGVSCPLCFAARTPAERGALRAHRDAQKP